ncbi:HEAT repeat domain-containing protein [Pontibacter silvestris]|uniref:HEAT repeat domain-containing protein n=1 Tax=Pontibacter silvestris TaxID=2305183 RepID=A0ABW4X3P8_9BACT|nr:hypothetical protein [Pontibacter silvestris]MCC9135074.1 hypothetical protein [Pontibacter silvestris]
MGKFYKLLNIFAGLPETVDMILHISLSFFAVTFVVFLFIIFSRIKEGMQLKRQKWLERESQEFITSFLFDEEWTGERTALFRAKTLTTTSSRQIFLENLIRMHKNIIGESSNKLSVLYQDLGLYQHSKQKLYSDSWDVIATGISELAEMGMRQDTELIRSFIKQSNTILRSEALVALVKLEKDVPFSFLNELSEPLSGWQQMQLAKASHKAHFVLLPEFKQWLTNHEESIVVFSTRMVVQHAQHKAIPSLIKLLQHPSAEVRKEVIIALRQLEASEATESLIGIYPAETKENKLHILKALPIITLDDTFEFYETVLRDSDKSLQIAAARALIKSGGTDFLFNIKNDLQHALQSVAAFVLDPRI